MPKANDVLTPVAPSSATFATASNKCAESWEHDHFRHVARSLMRAKRWRDLHRLVQDVEWYRDSHARDPAGILYATDIELAYQAASNAGAEGLAILPSLSLRATRTTLAGFARLPLEGLVCLVRLDQGVADIVAEHISRTLPLSQHPEAYLAIASVLSALGNTDKAYTLATRALAAPISDPAAEALILARAGQVFAQVGAEERAAQLLDESFHLFREATPFWWEGDISVNTAIAVLLAYLGQWEQAATSLKLVLDHTKQEETTEEIEQRMSDLLTIGAGLHLAREPDLAIHCIETAVQIIEKKSVRPRSLLSEWNPEHTRCLAKAMRVLVDIGQRERAQKLRVQLLSSTRFFADSRIEETTDKVALLCSTALALTHVGDDRMARSILDQAVYLAQSAPIEDLMTFKEIWSAAIESLGVKGLPSRLHLALVLAPNRTRILALIQLAKALADAGARQTAYQAFLQLISEASQAREKEGFLARLEEVLMGVYQTDSGFALWLALPAMIQSREPGLVDLALTLINHEDSPRTPHHMAAAGEESCSCICTPDRKIPKLRVPWELAPMLADQLVQIDRCRDAAAVLTKCLILKPSEPVIQKLLERLASAGDLEGAIALTNMLGKRMTGCACLVFTPLVLGMALLLLLLSWAFHHVLGWICLSGVAYGAVIAGLAGLVALFAKDTEGFSHVAKLMLEEEALTAIVRGFAREGQLQAAYKISKKIGNDHARALALIEVAEAATLAGDSGLFRTAAAQVVSTLTKATSEEQERADIMIALAAALQRSGPDYASQLEGDLVNCLELASKIRKAPLRMSAIAAVANCLLACGEYQMADVLQEVIASGRKDRQVQGAVIQSLGKANDLGTLERLWKLGFVADSAGTDQMVKALGKALLEGEDLEGFRELIAVLKRLPDSAVALSGTDYIGMLKQATQMLDTGPSRLETRGALREAFIIVAESVQTEAQRDPEHFWSSILTSSAPSLAQLGHALGMDSEVLEILKRHLDALRQHTQGVGIADLGSAIEAYAKVAQALSELGIAEAKVRSIDTLHTMFRIAHASGAREYAWYAIWHAPATLTHLADQKVLREAWEAVRQAESAIDSVASETIHNYGALLS